MRVLILSLILANLFLSSIIFDYVNQKNLVDFLDVGQGSGVLIKNKNNIFLYDTGKYPNLILKQIDKHMPFYNKKIDIIFISHQDIDHYFSVFELIKRYKVRLIITSFNNNEEDSTWQKLIKETKNRNIPLIVLKRGDYLLTKDFKFFILNPNKKFKKDNNNSLVIKLQGKNSYIFSGDIEKEAIQSLIKCCKELLKADFLLVPHHGSKNSIDDNFYKLIEPKILIIQTGKNIYKHPHKETLNFFKNLGYEQKIWRTDLQKNLLIIEN